MAEQNITLQPGESKDVSFEATPNVAKDYQVSVDGLSGSFGAVSRGVSVTLVQERVCNKWYGGECVGWASDERSAVVTVTNNGQPRQLSTTLDGREYLSGELLSPFFPTQVWSDHFDSGQSRSYSIRYVIPTTGLPVQSWFFIEVKDDSGVVFSQEYLTALRRMGKVL